ncbi:MAG TPA: GTPase HflX [Actinomycetota bacterium]|nr:GTPase HflX [Actinomycetota bacterium]
MTDLRIEEQLADREALRRVPGLSTELEDISEVEYRQVRLERVVLVGVWTQGTAQEADRSLLELARLAETAGSVVLEGLIQRRSVPDPATYVGSGKAKELRDIVRASGADTVICDGELTPGQLRKLEAVVGVKVVDRTWLILDIFAQHARSREGKAQVALAQMEYMLPRLRGWGEALSQQGAGIGTRGPGETKIETDRRRIRAQMTRLRRQLRTLDRVRSSKSSRRRASDDPSVVLAGYTNAGKSSLLNRLTGAGLLVDDALFATLDPTVRAGRTPSGRHFTITDTVGFVRHLPHELVEAFKSTLEEVAAGDLLLVVLDGTDPDPFGQLQAVRDATRDSDPHGAELVVVNKADVADPDVLAQIRRELPDSLEVSARTGHGLAELLQRLDEMLPDPRVGVDAVVPFDRGDLVSRVYSTGTDVEVEHVADGSRVRAKVSAELAAAIDAAANHATP